MNEPPRSEAVRVLVSRTPARLPGAVWLDRGRARDFCRPFFDWHRDSGIGLMTPTAVDYGRAEALHNEGARVLATAFAADPEHFVRGVPTPPALPTGAWINRLGTQEIAR